MDPSAAVPACPSCGAMSAEAVPPGTEMICPQCGTSFVHRVPFGRYLVEQKLGAGGMATVYLAFDPPARRWVALKIIHRGHLNTPGFQENLLQEAETLLSLHHPNIVEFLDSGQHDSLVYLATEFLQGGNLEQRIAAHGPMGEAEALDLGRGIASGLKKAYAQGLVHRDIKPANILFSPVGHPKLVDFGLCLPSLAPQENAGEVWGTAGYLPPERLERAPEGFASDIYSLGATLFHALTGRAPHLEQDLEKVARRYEEGGEGPPPPLRSVAPHVSEETAAIIDRALQRRPEDRFGSYEELLEALALAKIAYWKKAKPE
ncbi:MAG: protein kinase [Verrucomicrobium sp.]|nr:protein kinase [Verrucomicrobium sp.]